MGYLNPFVGYKYEPEEIKMSELGYLLTIGSSASSLISIYQVGSAGSDLYNIGNRFPSNYGYKLQEAGDNLMSYRTLSYISFGLSTISSYMLASVISTIGEEEEYKNEKGKGKILTASGLALAGLVIKIFAVDKVGDAGELIVSFSNDLKYDWQKHYFSKCGLNLKLYESRWNKGLYTYLGGIGLFILSGSTNNLQISRSYFMFGLLAFLSSHVYTEWLAPFKLGSSGSNLSNFEVNYRNMEK